MKSETVLLAPSSRFSLSRGSAVPVEVGADPAHDTLRGKNLAQATAEPGWWSGTLVIDCLGVTVHINAQHLITVEVGLLDLAVLLGGIVHDKIRVNSSSLDHPLVILPDQGIEIVAIEKKVMVGRTMRSQPRPNRASRGGLRSDDQVTTFQRTM
jgi:hypothetical protein